MHRQKYSTGRRQHVNERQPVIMRQGKVVVDSVQQTHESNIDPHPKQTRITAAADDAGAATIVFFSLSCWRHTLYEHSFD